MNVEKQYRTKFFKLTFTPAPKTDPDWKSIPTKDVPFRRDPFIERFDSKLTVHIELENPTSFTGLEFFKHENITPSIRCISTNSIEYKFFNWNTVSSIPDEATDRRIYEMKSMEIIDDIQKKPVKSKFIYITYPKEIKNLVDLHDYIKNKLLAFDSSISIAYFSIVAEISLKLNYPHTHAFIELASSLNNPLPDFNFFNLEDGTHPNIIGMVNYKGNIRKRIFFYHMKSGALAYDSLDQATRDEWREEYFKNVNLKAKLNSFSAYDIEIANARANADPQKAKEMMSAKELANLKKLAKNIPRSVDLYNPEKHPTDDNYLLNLISFISDTTFDSEIMIVYSNDKSSLEHYSDFLYSHFPCVCKTNNEKTIEDSILTFNNKNIPEEVNTLIIDDLKQINGILIEKIRKIRSGSFKMVKIKTSTDLKYNSKMKIIIFTNNILNNVGSLPLDSTIIYPLYFKYKYRPLVSKTTLDKHSKEINQSLPSERDKLKRKHDREIKKETALREETTIARYFRPNDFVNSDKSFRRSAINGKFLTAIY
jgi:hypothetical protein